MPVSPSLPTELLIIILSIAAAHHPPTATRLCLVSNWVRDLVDPILYRVVTFRAAPVPALLSSPNFCKNIRHLGITGVVAAHNTGQSQAFTELRSFAIDSSITPEEYKRFITSGTHFEELHATAGCFYWLRTSFTHLRRLHLTTPSANLEYFIPVEHILQMTRLTHAAISISIDPMRFDQTYSFLERLVVGLVQLEHTQLELIFVRLLTDSTRTTVWPRDLIEDIPKDPRFIVKVVFLKTEKVDMLDEWEQNALNGESIWDDALIGAGS